MRLHKQTQRRWIRVAAAVCVVNLILDPIATLAGTIDWSATAGTTAWATGNNWVGGTTPTDDTTTDIAQFNQASYANQPNVGTRSVNGVIVGSSSATLTLSGTTLTVGGGNISVSSPNATTISTGLAGTASLFKSGAGAITLSGANTYSGGTTLTNGTLTLDFTTDNTANKLAGGTLTMAGGTLAMTGHATLDSTETVSLLTIGGAASVSATLNTAGSRLNFTNITQNSGGAVNFTLPSSGNISIAKANTSNGILGGWATVGQNTWAVSAGDGANLGAISGLANASYYDGTAPTASSNLDNKTAWRTLTTSTMNSLRFSANYDLNLLANSTTVITSGGILMNSGVAARTIGGTNPMLTSGNGKDLVVHQYSTAGALTLPRIVDNGATPIGLTKIGPGTLGLVSNTYSGDTWLLGGSVSLNWGEANPTLFGIGGALHIRDSGLGIPGGTQSTFSSNSALYIEGGYNLFSNGSQNNESNIYWSKPVYVTDNSTLEINSLSKGWSFVVKDKLNLAEGVVFTVTGTGSNKAGFNGDGWSDFTGGLNLQSTTPNVNAATMVINQVGTAGFRLSGTFSGGAAGQTLTLGGNAAVTITGLTASTNNPGITVTGSDVHVGTGNTFTGGIVLNGGTLKLENSLSSTEYYAYNSGTFTVTSSKTIAVTKYIGGSGTIANFTGLTGTGNGIQGGDPFGAWGTAGAGKLGTVTITPTYTLVSGGTFYVNIDKPSGTIAGNKAVFSGTLNVNTAANANNLIATMNSAPSNGDAVDFATYGTAGTGVGGTFSVASWNVLALPPVNVGAVVNWAPTAHSPNGDGSTWADGKNWDLLTYGTAGVSNDTGNKRLTLTFNGASGYTAPLSSSIVSISTGSPTVTGPTGATTIAGLTLGNGTTTPTLTLQSGGALTVTNAVTISSGTLNAAAAALNAGSLTVNGGSATLGTTPASPIATATVSGGTLTVNAANAVNACALNGTGTLAGNGQVGTVTVASGTPTFSGNCTNLVVTGGTLAIGNGATTANADFSAGTGVVNANTVALTITNKLIWAGSLTAINTVPFTAGGSNLVNINAASTITVSGGILTFTISATAVDPGVGGTSSSANGNWIHKFTSSGIFNASGQITGASVLVVGGGGGGGGLWSTGGGAGGLVYRNGDFTINNGDTTVTIGAGGTGGLGNSGSPNYNGLAGADGQNSVFGSLTALGGGGGGGGFGSGSQGGRNGGSGGGGQFNGAGTATQPGSASGGFGNNGGCDGTGNYGGGGGAGVAGSATGNGGDGLSYSISGTSTYYGGGGGGLGSKPGGSGGGGTGGASGQAGGAGTPNTGGGGGGSWGVQGGTGGSGIVIVSYPLVSGPIDLTNTTIAAMIDSTVSLSRISTNTLAGLNVSSAATLTVTNSLQLNITNLTVAASGANCGKVFMAAGGKLALGNGTATLSITGSATAQTITLVSATTAVTGYFSGYPEGSLVIAGGRSYVISYAGGAGGKDVTLTQLAGTGLVIMFR